MVDTFTTTLALVKATVNDPAGEDLWGDKLNGNFDKIDAFARDNSGVVEIGDIVPATVRVGRLFWESDSSRLLLGYFDGDSSQWIQANATSFATATGTMEEPPDDGDIYARKGNGTWVATVPLDDYSNEQGIQDERILAVELEVAARAPLATISTDPPSGGSDGDVWYQVT